MGLPHEQPGRRTGIGCSSFVLVGCGIAGLKGGLMSLRNRARHLQRATGLSYQQALDKLRALGAAPAELRRKTGWPLSTCDRFLLDPAHVEGPPPPPAPIEVVELPERAPDELLAICLELLASTNARAISLLGPNGEILARTPASRLAVSTLLYLRATQPTVVPPMARGRHAVTPHEPFVVPIGDETVFVAPIKSQAILVVRFDRQTSLGLVRLRVEAARLALEAALARRNAPSSPLGGTGGAGGGGAPAEVSLWLTVPRARTGGH